jgi:hypothetical protein
MDSRNTVLTLAVVYLTGCLLIFNIDKVFCFVKHGTFKPPYGYHIVTNGDAYKVVYPSGYTSAVERATQFAAVTRAWEDWEYEQEAERKANAKWHTIEF